MTSVIMKKIPFLVSSLFLVSALNAKSQLDSGDFTKTVAASSCFFENASIPYTKLKSVDDVFIVTALSSDLEKLKIEKARTLCRSYIDITEDWNDLTHSKMKSANLDGFASDLVKNKKVLKPENFNISYETEVNELLSLFVADRMWEDLKVLTSFPNRAPNSESGMKAAEWLKSQSEEMARATKRSDIKVEFIKTGFMYAQPSVVVTIPGTDPTLDGVLVGGHFDTLSGKMPGTDDDGTGTVTVLETMRTVLSSGMKFKRNLYFVWYSAEEQGLIGSQYVSKHFKQNKIPLRAVLQVDMTGYQAQPENKIYMIDDYVDSSLSSFVSDLAVNYAKVEVGHTKCGYACSDHASWTKQGYRSAMAFETVFGQDSPYTHTANDTMDHVSLEHMSRFAKISISFAGELAEPVKD